MLKAPNCRDFLSKNALYSGMKIFQLCFHIFDVLAYLPLTMIFPLTENEIGEMKGNQMLGIADIGRYSKIVNWFLHLSVNRLLSS